MRRQLRPQDEALLADLERRVLLTIEFIEKAQPFPSGRDLKRAVKEATEERDLRKLRFWAKEVDAASLALPPYQREGLEAVLLSRLGIDKAAERAQLREHVLRVLKRGTIASEKERRRLEDYAEMLESVAGDRSEIAAVRALLARS